ncbi:MAG: DUF3169 family protein [Lachnospiraceae bacterium]|nr:DUF3169 family protein [Lachnospiraceae bacterium]
MSEKVQDKVNEAKEKKLAKRKKDDKKNLVIMLIVTIACGVLGYFAGMIIDKLQEAGYGLPEFTEEVIGKLSLIMPVVFFILNAILAIVAIACIRKSKKEFKLWDGEDEDVAEKMENRVAFPLYMSSLVLIINMFLFSVCANLDINSKLSDKWEDILGIVLLSVFILSYVVVVIVQKKVIDFTKDMNPEKEGSIFDAKFVKKWENSCDEAQKLHIYKAGYASYKVTSNVCMVLWIVCLIADLFGNVGLLPMTMVFVIWISSTIGYIVGGVKAEKEKNTIE